MSSIFELSRSTRLVVGALTVVSSAWLAGCTTVGPDYKGPPDVAHVKADTPWVRGGQNAGTVQAPVVADWWKSLNDATLNDLVAQALSDSPDAHAAQARLMRARAALSQQHANTGPKAGASALALGASLGPGTDSAQDFHFYNAGFDASWELDLFGGQRRTVEQAAAQAEAVAADGADVQVSLVAEVVQAYADLRGAQQRLAWLGDAATIDEQALALVRQREGRGVDTALDVERAVSRLQGSQRSVQEARASEREVMDRLALLTGQAPGALDARLTTYAPLPMVPAQVAIGDVSGLMQHRPDIRAAERRLAASTAQIGKQEAGYFPKLSLIGSIGLGATNPAALAQASSVMLFGAPYLSWNVFDMGRNKAAVRQADAARDEAQAKYASTVLQALYDANQSLNRFGQQRQSLLSVMAQEAAAGRSLRIVSQRREVGAASQLDLQDAQRTWLNAQQDTLSAQVALLKDFASLHKSLGLGWKNG